MRSTLPTFNEVWQRQFRASVLTEFQDTPEQPHFLIGCSGGMDSMLLLHLMSHLFPKRIRAIYIDHQLQDVSPQWGSFVQEQCYVLDVPCVIQAVDVDLGNVESQARSARYAAFQKHLLANEILVLAHHQQDQAETVLLRLLSGTGIHGLAAMQSIDIREQFTIWRPLLALSRQQIELWAAEMQLRNIQDQTNFDTSYDRAWCRAELWPILEQRFPKMQQALVRTSYLMQDAETILADVLAQDWVSCGNASVLNLTPFRQLSAPRQRQLLSAWMKGEDLYRPAFDMVQRLFDEVIESKVDAQAALHWNQYYYVRYQQQLFRVSKAEYLAEECQTIESIEQRFSLDQAYGFASGQYRIETQKYGLSSELLEQPLQIKPRLGGEKLHLYGRVGAWPLKKAIQSAQIFPWQRHTIQILSIDNVMLGVFTPKGFWLVESAYCEVGGWQPNLIA
ncbi:tRNA lysidine(34) synthetase TilS [Acinetobacter sp. SwsAc2]|uniref:tRNA lysidine(34) synthetase TilS n=1 Tax=Acinetobacter sp. SwsAc2 TaxID=2749360 RepID=UPI0015BDAFB6|nr:tRNA lysidine(34) synthetase TilS [Acinetobacter sp. SwsAc2]NWK60632.1 tRNA lysidine(34) synthetase TilS [Acinetobacter sp. SwsAc2]NWK64031.1 tRNA lysidine(34) synthetase TilS [Acinetobacter sp. SwsAc3]